MTKIADDAQQRDKWQMEERQRLQADALARERILLQDKQREFAEIRRHEPKEMELQQMRENQLRADLKLLQEAEIKTIK